MALQSVLLQPNYKISITILLLVLFSLIYFRIFLRLTLVTVALPITWFSSSDFFISQERDDFDVTFANYSVDQHSSQPMYPDLIPPVLHQILLGSGGPKPKWFEARSNCLKYHPGWDAHIWTDENAGTFVAEKFPHLKEMWESYRYPIQKIDALRYMVLHEYGGRWCSVIWLFLLLTPEQESCWIWTSTAGAPWVLSGGSGSLHPLPTLWTSQTA
jgi:mannosyltransferase OCH1-like enzyme